MGLIMHIGIIGSVFFVEKTVSGHDMLENFALPQIPPGLLFQQDDAPPPDHDVAAFLNRTFFLKKKGGLEGESNCLTSKVSGFDSISLFSKGFLKSVVYK
ncbi:hypothetical protein TNCV_4876201 [Trichonephila clavipes]|uniref:Uncharacterized protein n=1 Tax=Trichonephila clavipes TaxID=2585209 RepID=A0A8X6V315_TRICX|nr:hypothetical protein TNCV_4876201 [Trichonephila clavipes]